jgi:general secretion pathway protein G
VSNLAKPLAISGLGVFSLMIALVIWIESTSDERAVISDNRADFHCIGSALRSYKINTGHYPSTEQGLQALVDRPTTPPLPDDWVQIMTKVPTDPWRNEYRYRSFTEGSTHHFELISNGPDGIEGTKDDRSSLHQSHPYSKP